MARKKAIPLPPPDMPGRDTVLALKEVADRAQGHLNNQREQYVTREDLLRWGLITATQADE